MRPYTVELYLLRCKQAGFTLEELGILEEGEVVGAIVESANDHEKYNERGTKSSFVAMFGGK